LQPGNAHLRLIGGALLLHIGDAAGYERLCRDTLNQFRDTSVPEDALRAAHVCLLAPSNDMILAQAARLADKGLAFSAEQPNYTSWAYLMQGLSEVRRGNADR